ncbi:hypothetical protein ACFXG4_20525 [Nocardia sp. NPDC059246]|uniref:hypothetical protein n=1 Tax=unclassified Nocardia TaxID=2637762 RepID=UPI0036770F7C
MHAKIIRLQAADGTPPGRFDPATITAPTPDRLAPVRQTSLPVTGPFPPLFAVLGAHGGAGTSTLAQWWAHAADTGQAWPASPQTTQRVVIATRDCIPGLTAAAERLREWHSGIAPAGVTIVGLVVTAARPGRVPAAVRRYRRIVADLVDDAVWSIGWHDELLSCDIDDLARYTPNDPLPQRRVHPTKAVPKDVHQAATAITERIVATRSPTPSSGTEDTQ